MDEKTSKAITIKSFLYNDRKKIVKIFSKEDGIMSFMVPISLKQTVYFSMSSPFCMSEIRYSMNNNRNFQKILDIKIIDMNLYLRNDFIYLKQAANLMKTILFTQQNYKKNDVIFDLLYFCLRKLKIMKNPVNLTLNFLMKLIKLEGIANITKTCNLCNNIACYISKGESLCKKHMKCENLVVNESNIFSQNEINEIITLSNSRVLKEIDSIEASHLFINKIYKIFNDCF